MTGKFLSDQLYSLAIAPGALRDATGRGLAEPYALRFAFTRDAPALQWDTGSGLMERYGPQYAPLRGRGYERADLRIHPIDPLSRDFWPFPAQGVETQDAAPPPLPGAEPKPWKDSPDIEAEAIKERIKALGSPAVSRLVDLPLKRGGVDAKFGLDLGDDFARVNGRGQPGAYLVGLRAPNEATRRWMRVGVTDLSLTAIEEPGRVRFAVTSLSTARPVQGAQLRIEGVKDDKFVALAQGTTDVGGFYAWTPKAGEAKPKRKDGEDKDDVSTTELRRVVVVKGDDALVVDPNGAPAEYSKENWSKPDEVLALLDDAGGAGARRRSAHALPSLQRAPDLPTRGAGPYQGLCARLSRRRAEPAEIRRNARRLRSRRTGVAHSGQAGRRRRLLSQIRRQDRRDRRLHRQIRAGRNQA